MWVHESRWAPAGHGRAGRRGGPPRAGRGVHAATQREGHGRVGAGRLVFTVVGGPGRHARRYGRTRARDHVQRDGIPELQPSWRWCGRGSAGTG